MFVSHFLRGLGLALDPFVRGLMFYYGLDFHDLALDSFLHITTFIVVCEAFLRVTPHFGLWLKTFEVKPKMVEGQHAACGGASICKMTGAPWPKGSIQRCLNCGNRSGSTSRLLEVPSGRPPCVPLGPPTTADAVDQQRSELGSSQGRAYTAKPHLRSLQWKF